MIRNGGRVRPVVRRAVNNLVRYISDPSKVRSMLAYEFGVDEPLPPRAAIERQIAEVAARRASTVRSPAGERTRGTGRLQPQL